MNALHQRATEAWAKMIREKTIFDTIAGTEPMPPYAAIDYVQEESGGNREMALAALCGVASERLVEKYPEWYEAGSVQISDFLEIAICCVCAIQVCNLTLAEKNLSAMHRLEQEALFPQSGEMGRAHSWNLWRREASRAIEFLMELNRLTVEVES